MPSALSYVYHVYRTFASLKARLVELNKKGTAFNSVIQFIELD